MPSFWGHSFLAQAGCKAAHPRLSSDGGDRHARPISGFCFGDGPPSLSCHRNWCPKPLWSRTLTADDQAHAGRTRGAGVIQAGLEEPAPGWRLSHGPLLSCVSLGTCSTPVSPSFHHLLSGSISPALRACGDAEIRHCSRWLLAGINGMAPTSCELKTETFCLIDGECHSHHCLCLLARRRGVGGAMGLIERPCQTPPSSRQGHIWSWTGSPGPGRIHVRSECSPRNALVPCPATQDAMDAPTLLPTIH